LAVPDDWHRQGETGWTAHLIPLTVDGLIWASSMVMLDSARRGVRVPVLARWLHGLGIAATLTANVAHGLGHGPIGAAAAAWGAVALVDSYEFRMIIQGAQVAAAAPRPRDDAAVIDPLGEQAAVVFAADRCGGGQCRAGRLYGLLMVIKAMPGRSQMRQSCLVFTAQIRSMCRVRGRWARTWWSVVFSRCGAIQARLHVAAAHTADAGVPVGSRNVLMAEPLVRETVRSSSQTYKGLPARLHARLGRTVLSITRTGKRTIKLPVTWPRAPGNHAARRPLSTADGDVFRRPSAYPHAREKR
jgi:hypothetical protein